MTRLRLLFLLFLPLLSCSELPIDEKGIVLAKVNDRYLYESDLEGVIPKGTAGKDSIEMVRNYVHTWVLKQLVVFQAEKALPESQKNFQKQLEDYRNSLIVYEYESNLIRQRLDTIVTQRELEEYYQENQQNFELKENIVRVLYVKVMADNEDIPKLRKWLRSDAPDDRDKLELYCAENAVNYFLDDQTWLYFNDLLKEIPISTYNQDAFLRSNSDVEIEDYPYLYLLRIMEYQLKEGISPISLEIDNIRNVIINKRKIELIRKMRDDLYQQAVDQKLFEVYVPGIL